MYNTKHYKEIKVVQTYSSKAPGIARAEYPSFKKIKNKTQKRKEILLDHLRTVDTR